VGIVLGDQICLEDERRRFSTTRNLGFGTYDFMSLNWPK
jgi:hypothetical protein